MGEKQHPLAKLTNLTVGYVPPEKGSFRVRKNAASLKQIRFVDMPKNFPLSAFERTRPH